MQNDVILYTAKDIQRIFQCGRKKAYEIMHIPGFPAFKVNNLMYVEKQALSKWVSRQQTKIL